MTSLTFSKSSRLLKAGEFDRVFANRCSRADRRIILYARGNDLGYPRLGLVVSKKCGNSVRRSRWKRCLREAFRLAQHRLPPSLDLVVVPRPLTTPSTASLEQSLLRLAEEVARRIAEDGRRPQHAGAP